MQAAYGVRPPRDARFTPLDEHGGMMSCFLGKCANAIGERESLHKVLERKCALKVLDTLMFGNVPVGELLHVLTDLCITRVRRVGSTGFARLLCEVVHDMLLLKVGCVPLDSVVRIAVVRDLVKAYHKAAHRFWRGYPDRKHLVPLPQSRPHEQGVARQLHLVD